MKRYKKILIEKLGERLHYYEEIDSTNTVAKKMEAWEHGMVIIAENQTAGRGTYGRSFHSKAGNGIYMTIVINTDVWHFRNEKLATIYTAVAVSAAIAEVTKISPEVKWVNDLFVGNRKIGGILAEKDLQSNKLIIGIGINLSQRSQEFPVEIRNIAASLELDFPIDEQAAAIVIAIYEKMLMPGKLSDADTVLELYKEKLFIMRKMVNVAYGDDVFEAKVMDVDAEGRLVVCRDGKRLVFGVGEVRVKV